MKKLKALLQKKFVFGGLLAAALGIMAFSGVQTSRAALTYISEYYSAQVTVSDIGITLVENGKDISWRDYTGSDDSWRETSGQLLGELLGEGESLQFGRAYPEELCVRNTGSIDEYVRVIVTRYWEGPDGKQTDLSPELIDLHFLEGSWIVDESASTKERTVLYYTSPLAVGASTSLFADTIRIDDSLAAKVTESETVDENGFVTITRTFDYNGVKFMLEAEADGVQTHNAEEAIKSAWGVDVSIDAGGNLSLN